MERIRRQAYVLAMSDRFPRFNRAAAALRADRLTRELDELRALETDCMQLIRQIAERLQTTVNRAEVCACRERMGEVLIDTLWPERKRVRAAIEEARIEAGPNS